MVKKFKITTDLFSIPCEDQFMIYAPLKRTVFLVNEPAVELLTRMKEGELSEKEIENNYEIFEQLEEEGIVNNPGNDLPSEIKDDRFLPTQVTLIPTTNCNLRCVYCYARAGEKIKNMDWEVAKASIDMSISSALKLKNKSFHLGFHGGGEPTLRLNFLRKCIKYAEKEGNAKSLEPKFSIVTNGVMEKDKADFMAQNIDNVLFSVDGPKDVQDKQRPMPNGDGSSKNVFKTIERFDELGIRYGIRSTITQYSVDRMTEIIDFFHENFQSVEHIQFEPLFGCGRSLDSGWKAPSEEAFIENYDKAKKKASSHRLNLRYSGADLERISTRFCGAAGDNCYVTPDGFISSCIEVTSNEDPRSKLFFYGEYSKEKKKFEVDKEQLLKLRNTIVENMESCQKCFLKWNCAGDCLAKRFYKKDDEPLEGPRCEINRALALIKLKEIIDSPDFNKIDAIAQKEIEALPGDGDQR